MNPYSSDQRYPLYLVEQALFRCQQERENAEYFIRIKTTVLRTIRQGRESFNDWNEEITLPNGTRLPSPRSILEHDEQYHMIEIERQKAVLADIKTAELTLKNAIRQHKKSYDTTNFRKLAKRQHSYDRHHTLMTDLDRLQRNLTSLNQELDEALARYKPLLDQATTSSFNNSANSNDD